MAVLTEIRLSMRLPWWWRPYLGALRHAARLGLRPDLSRVADRIINHTRFEVR